MGKSHAPYYAPPSPVLTHFDDCAGIGGFSYAAQFTDGIETRWAREIDDYARSVYARHFPTVELFRDVRGPLPDELVSQVGIYTAGFPCQPVSVAGKQLGTADERWIWPDISRTICFLRPKYLLLENVPGLLIRGIGDVLGDLAQIGYDTEWESLSAAAFGAPHIRDRVWILAYARREPGMFRGVFPWDTWDGCEFIVPQGDGWRTPKRGKDWDLAPLVPGLHPRMAADWWRSQSCVDRTIDGIPGQLDRNTKLGNAIVPQVAAWIMRRIIEADAIR